MAAWAGLATSQVAEERLAEARSQRLKSEARFLASSLWSNLEMIRDRALGFYELRAHAAREQIKIPLTLPGFIHWAEIERDGERFGRVRQSAQAASQATPINESYLQAVIRSIDSKQLAENGVAAIRVRQAPDEYLALVFPLPANASSPGVLVALVDPSVAFGGLERVSRLGTKEVARAFLVGNDGVVLAHTQRSYAGSEFAQFRGVAAEGEYTYRSLDRLNARGYFARLGTLSLGVVTEHPESESVSPLMDALARTGWIGALMLLALAALCFFMRPRAERPMRSWREKTLSDYVTEPAAEPASEPALESAPPQAPLPIGLPELITAPPVTRAAESLADTRASALNEAELRRTAEERIRRESEIGAMIARYEHEAAALKGVEQLAHRLADMAARAVEGPVLYFSFQPAIQSAVLHTYSGFEPGKRPPGMTFPVTEELRTRLLDGNRESAAKLLTEYPPLSRLLLARISGVVSCEGWEAWPITSYLRPRVLGFLIVLKPRPESQQQLARMVRATGLKFAPESQDSNDAPPVS